MINVDLHIQFYVAHPMSYCTPNFICTPNVEGTPEPQSGEQVLVLAMSCCLATSGTNTRSSVPSQRQDFAINFYSFSRVDYCFYSMWRQMGLETLITRNL